jgi:hypothetical protein
MDFKKEKAWLEVLCGIADLPLGLQDIVFEDILESAKTRIATIKRIEEANGN